MRIVRFSFCDVPMPIELCRDDGIIATPFEDTGRATQRRTAEHSTRDGYKADATRSEIVNKRR